jgi:uncharacterized membrane protein HdeD (DUF308 family)
MKKCPSCNRTYPDDNFAFCLEDGTLLSAPYDPGTTKRGPAPRSDDPPPTEVLIAPTAPPKVRPSLESTIRAPAPQVPPFYSEERATHDSERKNGVHWLFRSALVLRGIAAIALGVLALILPHTWTAWVFLFGAYVLTGGVLAIVAGVKAYADYRAGWLLLVEGIFGVISCLYVAWESPALTRGFYNPLTHIEAWAMVTGAFQVGAAIQLRGYLRGYWLLALAGLSSILCSFALLRKNNFTWWAFFGLMATYFILAGIWLIAFGIRARTIRN